MGILKIHTRDVKLRAAAGTPRHCTAPREKRIPVGRRGRGAGPTSQKVGAQDLTTDALHGRMTCCTERADNEGGRLLLAAYLNTLEKAGGTCFKSKQDVTAEKNATSLQGLKDQCFLG